MTSTQVSQDYRSQALKYGYRKSQRKMSAKLLKNDLTFHNYTLRHYGVWNRGFGAVGIRACQTRAALTNVEMPVHLWDLTSVPQGNNSTSLQYPATFHRLNFSTETDAGVHRWDTILGGTLTPVTSFGQRSTTIDKNWSLYPTDSNSTIRPSLGVSELNKIVAPGAKSLLEKVNIKMILNGPQTKPTKWCIQLVHLKSEVTPGVSTSTNPNGTILADAFWSSIAKPYGHSPLDIHLPPRLQKYMKVLKTDYVIMDTPESGEDHLRARMRHMTMNMYLNRTCNYQWGTEADKIAIASVDVPENGFLNNNDNEYLTTVHPNARVYMMIRALCEYAGPNAVPTEQNFPSYDIILNTTHRSLD